MKFKVGDRVVCTISFIPSRLCEYPTRGKVYTIVSVDNNGSIGIFLPGYIPLSENGEGYRTGVFPNWGQNFFELAEPELNLPDWF